MEIAITGGSGFIGKKLVKKHLALGDSVRILSREAEPVDGVTVIQGDLSVTDQDLSEFVENVGVLYHCAGELRNESIMHDLHVKGTANLANQAAGSIKHWVQLSSTGVYGYGKTGIVDEGFALEPSGVYEETKAESEQLVLAAAKEGNFTCNILRPATIYGPGMPGRSLPGIYGAIKKRVFFYIGSKHAKANLVHVDNVIRALVLCGKNKQEIPQIYNLCDDSDWYDVITSMAAAMQVSKPFLIFPEALVRAVASLTGWIPGNPLKQEVIDVLSTGMTYSQNKIEVELDYRPEVSLKQGITGLIDSWQTG